MPEAWACHRSVGTWAYFLPFSNFSDVVTCFKIIAGICWLDITICRSIDCLNLRINIIIDEFFSGN